ncbi:MAG: hypothetical protein JKY93_01175 [Gammaproteobacteria bacterium]|nr:hypothetical protein [Gammaproteobacteria bacterium]
MTVNLSQIRRYIVIPTLHKLGLYSDAAERLVMATGMAESNFSYIDQVERGGDKHAGTAFGFFQMEGATHNDLHRNFLKFKPELLQKLSILRSPYPDGAIQMQGNMNYAAAMCRIHYRRIKAPLPKANDIEGLAHYWKKYYNTHLGAGTIDGFIQKSMPVWDLYK